MNHSNASFFIEIINGKEKGARFQIVSQKISIGRSADNDIVLNDSKVSRKHATVQITPEGMQIICLNPERKIFVGKQDITNAFLELPSIILIGNTKLKATMVSNMPSHLPISGPPSKSQKGSLQNLQSNNSLNNNQLMNFQNENKSFETLKKDNLLYHYWNYRCTSIILYFHLQNQKKKKKKVLLLLSNKKNT